MSGYENKNSGKSIRAKLLNVAKKENVFYQTILTRYFQERLLYRLSKTRFRGNFYLKGGALMYAYERFAARPTLDIDLLGCDISNDCVAMVSIFREICSTECSDDAVAFDVERISAQNIAEFRDYHGVRLSIPVRMDSISQVLTMDVGFGDVVTPAPIVLDYPTLLEQLPSVSILSYSIESVIAEKMHAVIDLADQNSRMKDYYDLYRILKDGKFDSFVLQEAIIKTFQNRHTAYDADAMFFRDDFAQSGNVEMRWAAFMRKITKAEEEPFADVAAFIRNALRPYWENFGSRG